MKESFFSPFDELLKDELRTNLIYYRKLCTSMIIFLHNRRKFSGTCHFGEPGFQSSRRRTL